MTLSEKVAYLKGVAEGAKFDPERSTEGKLISIMMDILEHMALCVEDTDDSVQAMADELEDISDRVDALEDWVDGEEYDVPAFGDDEDAAEEALAALNEDGFFELECPHCGDILVVDRDVLEDGSITCPGCGEKLEIRLEYGEEDEEDGGGED